MQRFVGELDPKRLELIANAVRFPEVLARAGAGALLDQRFDPRDVNPLLSNRSLPAADEGASARAPSGITNRRLPRSLAHIRFSLRRPFVRAFNNCCIITRFAWGRKVARAATARAQGRLVFDGPVAEIRAFDPGLTLEDIVRRIYREGLDGLLADDAEAS